jgi:hypothetical protein
MVDYPVNYFGSKNKDAMRILNEGNAEIGMVIFELTFYHDYYCVNVDR